MIITLEMLETKHACHEKKELFKETFGDAVEVTQENCLKAAKVHLDFRWAANNLLTIKQRAAYNEAETSLWAAYKGAMESLLSAYEEAKEPLWAAYEEAREPLWAAYEEAEVPLWAAYKESEAIAFYKAATGSV